MLRLAVLLVLWCFCLGISPASAAFLEIPGTGDSQELLRDLAHSFMRAHPDVTIEIPDSIGSSGGVRNVIAGSAVIARVARPLKPAESEAGLQTLVFALSPVVLAANLPTPCLTDISSDQLVAIYSGVISNWHELGTCPDHAIYVANRELGDSSRTALENNIPGFKAITDPVGKTIYTTPETAEILIRYPYTIAYLPLAALEHSQVPALPFNGVPPTREQVRTGSYPLTVSLGLVWKGSLTPLAKEFIDYLFSPEGQRQIRNRGLVPAPKR